MGDASQALIALYHAAGRDDEARALAMKTFRENLPGSNEPNDARTVNHVRQLTQLAGQLLSMDDPLDALRVCLVTRDRLGQNPQKDQLQVSTEASLAALKRVRGGEVLDGLIPEKPGAGPAVDLLVLVHPNTLTRGELKCVLEEAVRSAADEPGVLSGFLERLGEIRALRPKDLDVALAEFLAASAGGGDRRAALDRLAGLADERPLDAIVAGGKLTPRQRATASGQVPLWFAARDCLRREGDRAVGLRLGERALAASRRQLDPAASLAILLEWGRIERVRGDRAAARSRWSEMIAQLDDKARLRPAAGAAPKADSKGATPLLPAHCRQVLEIAAFAAREGDVELSLSTVLDALRDGPPALPAAQDRFTYATGQAEAAEVAANLVELEGLWREKHAPAELVYRTLLAVVLPEARPDEVFPYSVDVATIENEISMSPFRPRSAARALAEWATRANRLDELTRLVEARRPRFLAESPARVVLAQIGRVSGDDRLVLDQVEWFARRLEKDSGNIATTNGIQVALASLDRPAVAPRAVELLEHAVRQTVFANPQLTWLPSARREVALARLATPDLDRARGALEEYLRAAAPLLPVENPETIAARHNAHKRAVSDCVAAGRPELAWEFLGRLVDLGRSDESQLQIFFELEWLLDGLAARSPAERYSFLERWVVPADPKKPLRLEILGALIESASDSPEGGWRPIDRPPVDTLSLLVDAARRSGRLDDLARVVEPLARAGRENAGTLARLVAIARGPMASVKPLVLERASKLEGDVKTIEAAAKLTPATYSTTIRTTTSTGEIFTYNSTSTSQFVSPVDLRGDALLALGCLGSSELRAAGLRIADLVRNAPPAARPPLPLLTKLRAASAGWKAASEAGVDPTGVDLGLRHWVAEGGPGPGTFAEGWAALEGHLLLLPGSLPRPIRLARALQGPFEFRCEASEAALVEFGGRSFRRFAPPVAPAAPSETSAGDGIAKEPREIPPAEAIFHAYRLAVDADKLRCWIDGRLVYQSSDVGRSFPWLSLAADAQGAGPVVFRNLRLSGNPRVVREVPLSGGDRLRWSSEGAEPLGASGARDPFQPDPDQYYPYGAVPPEPRSPTWTLADGTISGSLSPNLGGRPGPHHLTYARGLRDGDSVRYEFRHEPGAVMVHPTLGRRIFLIQPEGVTLRVLEAYGDGQLAASTTSTGPKPGPVRLKPDDWNALVLSIRDGLVTIQLNGEVVATTPLDPDEATHFGLFHARDRTAALVRDVQLTLEVADSELSDKLDLLEPSQAGASLESRRYLHALIGEGLLKRDARSALARSRGLTPLARFESLRDWVLPKFATAPPRLEGDFPAGVPAVELVEVAKDLGKLDELADSLRDLRGPEAEAFGALIGLARGRDVEVSAALGRLLERLERGPDPLRRPDWPEYVAAVSAVRHPPTRLEGTRLLEAAVARLDPEADATPLSLQIRHAAEVARLPGPPLEPASTVPRLLRWVASSQPTSTPRGRDFPRGFWTAQDGEIRHHPGRDDDTLIFTSPLVGEFEFRCEIPIDAARAVSVEYAGLAVAIAPDGKSYRVASSGSPGWSAPIDPPLDPARAWHAYRLAVRAGRAEVAVDDRPIHEALLPAGADPWLVLHGPAHASGAIRHPTLLGHPAVPASLELASSPLIPDWLDAFQAPGASNPAWSKVGLELVGRTSRLKLGLDEESLLRYRRPLLDGDAVEYEFESRPGKSLVSPALGRFAFRLEPGGVTLRPLEDGDDPPLGPLADDAAGRRGPVPLPLRAGEWNQMRLSIEGDRVKLRLNGVEVYERSMGPVEERTFGFFHHADATEARVRAIQLLGSWPRTLPGLDGWLVPFP